MKQFYLKILLICFFLCSCSKSEKYDNVEGIDKALRLTNGVLYYKDVLFTGNVVSYYDVSKLKSETIYENGRKQGYERQWLANGELIESRFYLKGKKAGIHKAWWGNGNLKFEYHFNNNGEYHGTVKDWYSSGQLLSDFNYENGIEVGSQKMWKLDGSLKANYEVVNGERFGLIGLKKCYQVTVGSNEVIPAKAGILAMQKQIIK